MLANFIKYKEIIMRNFKSQFESAIFQSMSVKFLKQIRRSPVINNILSDIIYESKDEKNLVLRDYYRLVLNEDTKNAIYIKSISSEFYNPAVEKIQKSIERAKLKHAWIIEEHVEHELGYLPRWYLSAKVMSPNIQEFRNLFLEYEENFRIFKQEFRKILLRSTLVD
jgi:hypothetical protein